MTHSECRVYDEDGRRAGILHGRRHGARLRRSRPRGRRQDRDVTLTSARGPLGPDPAGRFSPPIPPGTVFVEPHARRIQAVVGGRTVIDTEAALLVHRPGAPAVVRLSRRRGRRPAARAGAGGAGLRARALGRRRHLDRGGPPARALPAEPVPPGRLPAHHAPAAGARSPAPPSSTPTTRSSCSRPRSRRSSTSPRPAVRTDLLQPVATRRPTATTRARPPTGRPTIGDMVVADVAWSYEDPFPESSPIQGWLSFDPERADLDVELPTQDR